MRILIVEDHKPTRDEVTALIEQQPDMCVVAQAESGEEALAQVRAHKPDVVVMDILLPGMNGIETTRRILAEEANIKVLALSNHFGASLIQAILDAGGLGYIHKNRAFEDLIPALRSVHAHGQVVVKGPVEPSR